MNISGLEGLLGSLGAEPTAEARRNDELNRTDFLNLLVAQLQNQDPLNPLESTDFTAQLAQFSSLEQLMQINQKLGADSSAPTPTGALDAIGFLGHEIGFGSKELWVADGLVPSFDLRLAADSQIRVEVLDLAGQGIATLDLGTLAAGRQTVDLGAIGGAPQLSDGSYRLRITATDAAGGVQDLTPVFRARVDGVDLSSGTPVLLAGNRRIDVAEVREIRAPPPATAAGV